MKLHIFTFSAFIALLAACGGADNSAEKKEVFKLGKAYGPVQVVGITNATKIGLGNQYNSFLFSTSTFNIKYQCKI
jgi:hypothetical protein